MTIYGTAILSFCLLAGMLVGQLLGHLIGLPPVPGQILKCPNVGGVGIAMLLLIVVTHWLQGKGRLSPPSEAGILFWSSIYIPIVVAMVASLNVRAAVQGGPLAFLVAFVVVLLCFALVPLISRLGKSEA